MFDVKAFESTDLCTVFLIAILDLSQSHVLILRLTVTVKNIKQTFN